MVLIAFLFGILGLLIGSFLNVVVLRKGIEPITGRSHCSSCGYTLEWYDLVPVFSWIALGGRCRKCGSSISVQYPLVEMLNGVLYGLVGGSIGLHLIAVFSWSYLVYVVCALVIVSLLVVITVYDFRHTIIPDEWVYTFAALALFIACVFPPQATSYKLLTVLSGPIAAFPLFLLWLVSGGRWMGLGDPKLALGIGWLLGFPVGLIAIFLSFIIGTAILLPFMAFEKIITHMRPYKILSNGLSSLDKQSHILRNFGISVYTQICDFLPRNSLAGLTIKSEVPFGPFLVASALLLWFFQLYGISFPLELLGL